MAVQKVLGEDLIPAIKAKVDKKQDKLESGVNVKTINNESVLGSGNIELPSAKLYGSYGSNTDGALTQAFASEKLQALEGVADKTVQFDTKLGTVDTSTVSIIKTTGTLNVAGPGTDTPIALPVASSSQAGVINTATYNAIQQNAENIDAILNGSVSITGIPASPSQSDLTAKWKAATGKDNLVNHASIFDEDNQKVWTYYANVSEWKSISVKEGETVTVSQATNTSLGIVKGSTQPGRSAVESNGELSVNGWDDTQNAISANTSAISTNTSAISANSEAITANASAIAGLRTSKQDTLVSGTNIKTVNGNSILGSGDITIDAVEYMSTAEFEQAWNAA